MKNKLLAAAALVAGLAVAGTAHATLMISVNGTPEPGSDPTNTSASFSGSVGAFNINSIAVSGINAFGNSGEIFDLSSLNISTNGGGSITIDVTETGLTAPGAITFSGQFTGLISNANVTRSFYLDPTNNGLNTDLLGTTTTNTSSANVSTSSAFGYGASGLGTYSVSELITITANGTGAKLSSDDAMTVPEPATIALLGAGLVGIGAVRRRRRGKSA